MADPVIACVYALSPSGGAEIAISDDGGFTWGTTRSTPAAPTAWTAPDFYPTRAAIAIEPTSKTICMMDDVGLIIRTTDQGQNWSFIETFNDYPGNPQFLPQGMAAGGGGFLAWGDWFDASNWVVGYSTDDGATWTRQAAPTSDTPTVAAYGNGVWLLGSTANNGTSNEAELFRSSDGGANWSNLSGHGIEGAIRSITHATGGFWFCMSFAAGSTRKYYVSSNNGTTWTEITAPGLAGALGPLDMAFSYNTDDAVLLAAGTIAGQCGYDWSADDGSAWDGAVDLNPPLDFTEIGEVAYLGIANNGDGMYLIREGDQRAGYILGFADATTGEPVNLDSSARSFPCSDGELLGFFVIFPGTGSGGGGVPVAGSIPAQVVPKTFQLLSGPLASSAIASFDGVSIGKLEFRVDNNDRGTLSVDEEAPWLPFVVQDMVMVITDHNDRTTDWRVEEIAESDEGDGLAHLVLMPLYRDLGRIKVRLEVVGGPPELQVTVTDLTCEEIYDQVLAPLMPTWVSKGSFHSTQKLSTTQAWSIQQWLDWMAEETAGEVDFRRIATDDYEVHIVAERGAAGNTIVATPGKQVLELGRTRRLGDIATHLIPEGMVVPGAIQPAGLGQNALRVVSVFTSGPDYIDVEDPNGAESPVFFDDEFNQTTTPLIARTPHLVAIDGSLHQILDTEVGPPARLYVADASAFSVDDHVTVVKDANGSHLPGLFDPAAVSQWGVIEAALQLPKLRGERNYAHNSEPRHWTPDGTAFAGQSDGGSSGSSMPLKNLLPNHSIAAGTHVVIASPGVSPVTVASPATADGSGNVTLSLSGSMSVSNNQVVYLVEVDSGPDDWTVIQPGISPVYRTSRRQSALLCDADGTQSGTLYLAVKNLTPGDYIGRGWSVAGTKTIHDATADGSGDAVLNLLAPVSVTDNDPVTIQPIVMGADAGNQDRVIALGHGIFGQASGIETLPVAILPQGMPIHAQAWCTSEIGDWDAAASGQYTGPRIDLIPATGTGANQIFGDIVGEPVPFDLILRCTVPAPVVTTTWKVRITPPVYQDSPIYQFVLASFYVRGVMIHCGHDPNAPFVFGAHANNILHSTHRSLAFYGQPETSYVLTMRDLSALVSEGYIQSHNVITLGAKLRIVSERFGVDVERRIMVYVVDLVTPENSGIVLEHYEPELTRLLVEIRQQQEAA